MTHSTRRRKAKIWAIVEAQAERRIMAELATLARQHTQDALNTLITIAFDAETPHTVRAEALTHLDSLINRADRATIH